MIEALIVVGATLAVAGGTFLWTRAVIRLTLRRMEEAEGVR
jgi:hypothetical protein